MAEGLGLVAQVCQMFIVCWERLLILVSFIRTVAPIPTKISACVTVHFKVHQSGSGWRIKISRALIRGNWSHGIVQRFSSTVLNVTVVLPPRSPEIEGQVVRLQQLFLNDFAVAGEYTYVDWANRDVGIIYLLHQPIRVVKSLLAGDSSTLSGDDFELSDEEGGYSVISATSLTRELGKQGFNV